MTDLQARALAWFTNNDFSPVDIDHFSVFKEYDGTGTRLHETTATVSVIWGFAFHAVYKIILGYLCSVWFYQNGEVYVIVQQKSGVKKAPDSTGSIEELIHTLHGVFYNAGLPALKIWAVEERYLAAYNNVLNYEVNSAYSDDWSEYAYRPQDILELSGRNNFNKRNRIKKFVDSPGITTCDLNMENINDCLEIESEWCRNQDCTYCGSFAGCEKKSLELMIGLYGRGLHRGILVYINGTPAGFVIWELIGTLAVIYFAKSNVPNFNIYLYYILVKNYLSGAEWINIGHDMGKPGLRTFKQHLSVHELWRKYLCIFSPKGNKP
jgi:hypothetical protein